MISKYKKLIKYLKFYKDSNKEVHVELSADGISLVNETDLKSGLRKAYDKFNDVSESSFNMPLDEERYWNVYKWHSPTRWYLTIVDKL